MHRQHVGGVFMDADGILRYENTWLPAAIEEEIKIKRNDSSYLFQKTGCIELALILCDKNDFSKVPDSNLDNRKATIRLLADWEKLWSIFAENENGSDFVRRHIPLLKVFMGFFFHKRSGQTLIYLFLYNFLLATVCHATSSAELLISIGYGFLVISIYVTLYQLYKGPAWSMITFGLLDTHYKVKSPMQENSTSGLNECASFTTHDIHWTGSINQVFSATVASLCGGGKENELYNLSVYSNGTNRKNYQRYDAETFDDLMNISLMFLTAYGSFKTKTIQFHRWSYRMALLSTVTVIPFILICSLYYALVPSFVTACFTSYSHDACLYSIVYAVGSLFYITYVVAQVLFYGSVVVCLVGLCYGAEIAYWMTDSWIRRFSSLRRVASTEEEEKINILIENVSVTLQIAAMFCIFSFCNMLTMSTFYYYDTYREVRRSNTLLLAR